MHKAVLSGDSPAHCSKRGLFSAHYNINNNNKIEQAYAQFSALVHLSKPCNPANYCR